MTEIEENIAPMKVGSTQPKNSYMDTDKPTAEEIKNDPLFKKALAEYRQLPEVTDDIWPCKGIWHLVFWAQHEIDMIEEGERDQEPIPKADERKIRAFIKKWDGK